MTWIDDTSLAQGQELSVAEITSDNSDSIQALPEFLNNLFVKGVSSELIQAWLQNTDFSESINLNDCFKEFSRLYVI